MNWVNAANRHQGLAQQNTCNARCSSLLLFQIFMSESLSGRGEGGGAAADHPGVSAPHPDHEVDPGGCTPWEMGGATLVFLSTKDLSLAQLGLHEHNTLVGATKDELTGGETGLKLELEHLRVGRHGNKYLLAEHCPLQTGQPPALQPCAPTASHHHPRVTTHGVLYALDKLP